MQNHYYLLNEGRLVLPDALMEDNSANVLRFPKQNISLVITRAQLKPKQTLESYAQDQMAMLKKEMKGFLVDQMTSVTATTQSLQGYETNCEFEHQGRKIYQILLMLQRGQQLLVFTYSQMKPFSQQCLERWQAIKQGFEPAEAWLSLNHP